MYTKEHQLKKNDTLKEKPFKSKAYLEWFHNQNFGCFVCGDNNIEAHHLYHGNRGRRDDKIIPLCPECHRGSKLSPHGTPKKWKDLYQNEELEDIADTFYKQYKEEN